MDDILVPKKLGDLIIHKPVATALLNFNPNNLPNILLYGKKNNGKHTIAKLLINHLNGSDITNQTTINTHDFKIGNNTVTIEYLSSPYHIEINLFEYGLYDRYIISDFLNEYVNYKNISGRIKIIVLNHIDKISKSAQYSLRGLIEKNSRHTSFICLVTSLSVIEQSLQSRLMSIKIPLPSIDELNEYLDHVSENIVKLTKTKRKLLIKKRNIFELNYTISTFITHKKNLELDNYEILYTKIISHIEESNITSILKIRVICYNLLLINVNMTSLLKYIVNYYINRSDISDKHKMTIVEYSASISTKMASIEHDIICIEFFILKVKKLLIK